MHKTRGAALLAAAAMTMSGLAACGGEGEPAESSSTASPIDRSTDSPSETSSSTSSSSVSGSGSTSDSDVAQLPEDATKKTKAGAIAFNEFYFVESGRALTTGQTASLQKYARDCKPCDEFVEIVEESTAGGVRMNTNPTSVIKTSAKARSDSGYRVELDIKESAYHEVLADGSKGRTAEATSLTVVTDTQWTDNGWVIRDQVRTK